MSILGSFARLPVQISCRTINLPQSLSCYGFLVNVRSFNRSSQYLSESPNKDYVVSKVYLNRNPRNLEKLRLARKRLGWQFQAPRKDYYHRLVFSRSNRHTEAWIEHWSGEVVVSASSKEWAIRNQLYSCTDVSASTSVGKVLAQRCLESGITCFYFDQSQVDMNAEKVQSFLQELTSAHISLFEPCMIVPRFTPGINYDGYNRYAEPKVWKEDYQDI
ncbi:large ribosomal subunit protein uL18m-like [Physella acuta]|uniref:large ribosomal subunit protein uL18m-like n=1 Tax=Physella acuta TaxID=109671 RepID=UPI0027DE1053|nr:large ribosomal subunit protein uL18m-like [Physella acuta]